MITRMNREENCEEFAIATEDVCKYVNSGRDLGVFCTWGDSLLHWCVDQNDLIGLQVLLDSGLDPNWSNDNKLTPLHYSAIGGHLKSTKLLLKYGADPMRRDKDGWTPLHSCGASGRTRGHIRVAEYLIDSGIPVDCPVKKSYRTPLYFSFTWGGLRTAWGLLDKGADPDKPLPSGLPLRYLLFQNQYCKQYQSRFDKEFADVFCPLARRLFCDKKGGHK